MPAPFATDSASSINAGESERDRRLRLRQEERRQRSQSNVFGGNGMTAKPVFAPEPQAPFQKPMQMQPSNPPQFSTRPQQDSLSSFMDNRPRGNPQQDDARSKRDAVYEEKRRQRLQRMESLASVQDAPNVQRRNEEWGLYKSHEKEESERLRKSNEFKGQMRQQHVIAEKSAMEIMHQQEVAAENARLREIALRERELERKERELSMQRKRVEAERVYVESHSPSPTPSRHSPVGKRMHFQEQDRDSGNADPMGIFGNISHEAEDRRRKQEQYKKEAREAFLRAEEEKRAKRQAAVSPHGASGGMSYASPAGGVGYRPRGDGAGTGPGQVSVNPILGTENAPRRQQQPSNDWDYPPAQQQQQQQQQQQYRQQQHPPQPPQSYPPENRNPRSQYGAPTEAYGASSSNYDRGNQYGVPRNDRYENAAPNNAYGNHSNAPANQRSYNDGGYGANPSDANAPPPGRQIGAFKWGDPTYRQQTEEKKTRANDYAKELQEQIRLKKERENAEKERIRQLEMKEEREAMNYNPFGKPGAGAPMRDGQGDIVADLRAVKAAGDGKSPLAHHYNQQQRPPVQHFSDARALNYDAAGSGAGGYGGQQAYPPANQGYPPAPPPNQGYPPAVQVHQAGPDPYGRPSANLSAPAQQPAVSPSQQPKSFARFQNREMSEEDRIRQQKKLDAQQALLAQIEEKKRAKAEEERRRKMEDAEDERRLQRERGELQAAFEQESGPQKTKEELFVENQKKFAPLKKVWHHQKDSGEPDVPPRVEAAQPAPLTQPARSGLGSRERSQSNVVPAPDVNALRSQFDRERDEIKQRLERQQEQLMNQFQSQERQLKESREAEERRLQDLMQKEAVALEQRLEQKYLNALADSSTKYKMALDAQRDELRREHEQEIKQLKEYKKIENDFEDMKDYMKSSLRDSFTLGLMSNNPERDDFALEREQEEILRRQEEELERLRKKNSNGLGHSMTHTHGAGGIMSPRRTTLTRPKSPLRFESSSKVDLPPISARTRDSSVYDSVNIDNLYERNKERLRMLDAVSSSRGGRDGAVKPPAGGDSFAKPDDSVDELMRQQSARRSRPSSQGSATSRTTLATVEQSLGGETMFLYNGPGGMP